MAPEIYRYDDEADDFVEEERSRFGFILLTISNN